MDPFTVAIILIIVGAVLLIIEAFSPGAFMVIPGAVLLVGALIFAFGFRLKKETVEQYQAEINARQ